MRISDWSSDVCSSDLGAAALRIDHVDDDVERAADLRRELLGRNPRRQFHQPGVALLLDLLGHRIGKRVGGGALDGFEAERADAVELRFLQPVHQVSEIVRSEEHTSELQSLMRTSYAVFCLKKTKRT